MVICPLCGNSVHSAWRRDENSCSVRKKRQCWVRKPCNAAENRNQQKRRMEKRGSGLECDLAHRQTLQAQANLCPANIGLDEYECSLHRCSPRVFVFLSRPSSMRNRAKLTCLHQAMTIAACDTGKDVLVNKPLQERGLNACALMNENDHAQVILPWANNAYARVAGME